MRGGPTVNGSTKYTYGMPDSGAYEFIEADEDTSAIKMSRWTWWDELKYDARTMLLVVRTIFKRG